MTGLVLRNAVRRNAVGLHREIRRLPDLAAGSLSTSASRLSLPPLPPYVPLIMARPRPEEFDKKKIVAENRRARFDYAIEDKYEAGIVLTGTEVKSLRFGEGSIAESYAEVKDEEVWLINANIPEFSHGNRHNHEPKRPRKLLLNEREIDKLHGAVARAGHDARPAFDLFQQPGRAKVELALAKGSKAHDKREYEKEKDWKREQGRLMRDRG